MTAWESKEATQRFVYGPVHTQSIQAFPKYFTGRTFGYTSTSLPDWDEVHRIWAERGVAY